MSTDNKNLIRSPDALMQSMERGLNNFAKKEKKESEEDEHEQEDVESEVEERTPMQPKVEQVSTPTPKGKEKKKKGIFTALAAAEDQASNSGQTRAQQAPPVVQQQQQQQQQRQPQTSGFEQVISGRIVGSGAKEPNWTKEELQYIADLKAMVMPTMPMRDSRKSHPDPQGKYVVNNENGTCSATVNAMLPNLPFSEFKIGLGSPKIDDKLPKQKMYSDVIMVGINEDWVLNQWLSNDVIMEPVPASVVNSIGSRRGKRNDRTIGVHFARFGFPAKSFGPIFGTLGATIPGLLDSIVCTNGYYWTNASWGVTQSPATFVYLTENGTRASTPSLSEAMELFRPNSSKGVGTFAISIACGYEKEGDSVIKMSAKYEFSIKCHSFIHFEKSDYHGPPQTSAVGVVMGSDFMSMAKPLTKPKNIGATIATTGTLFEGGNMNPFAGIGVPRSIQQEGEKQATAGYL